VLLVSVVVVVDPWCHADPPSTLDSGIREARGSRRGETCRDVLRLGGVRAAAPAPDLDSPAAL